MDQPIRQVDNRSARAWLLIAPAALPIVIVFSVGIYKSLLQSLGVVPVLGLSEPSLAAYRELAGTAGFIGSAAYTVLVAIIAASATVMLGSFIAWVSVHATSKLFIYGVILTSTLCLIMPYGVMAQISQLMYAQAGLLARLAHAAGLITDSSQFPVLLQTPLAPGFLFAYILKGASFAIIVLKPYYQALYARYHSEYQTLGAVGISSWLGIYHAATARINGIIAAIMFAYVLGSIELPLWLGPLSPRMLSSYFYSLFQHPDLYVIPLRMALVIAMAVLGLLTTLLYGHGFIQLSKQGKKLIGIKWLGGRLTTSLLSLVYLLSVLLPLIWLVLRGLAVNLSFPRLLPTAIDLKQMLASINSPLGSSALLNGLLVAGLTGLVTTALAIPAGRAFARYQGFKGQTLAMLIIVLPLITPALVVIIGTVQTSVVFGLYGSHVAVSLCHVVMTLPYAVSIQATYQQQMGFDLEDAARTLGASTATYLRRIYLPLATAPIVLSFSMSFLISFTETFSTQIVGAGRIVTLGALLAPVLEYGDFTAGAAYTVLFIAINGIIFYAANRYASYMAVRLKGAKL